MTARKLLVFGAGNIGRSFVGQLFARGGYEVVFVDVNQALVEALNRERRYRIEIKDRVPETIWIEGVSAVHGGDTARVAQELAEADIAATAVGPSALPSVYPLLAAGVRLRHSQGRPPLDIIICENLRNAAQVFADQLRACLPAGFPLSSYVGLVETSIGKMVPIMPEAVRQRDALLLYAEAYNTLILDAKGFTNPIPEVPGLDPKQNIAAHVDRKSFIHNLGHAVCAYLGHLRAPEMTFIWQAVGMPAVRAKAKQAMWESARALIRRYPDEFNETNQEEHIEDLLGRFSNQALGDTIFRVGRDLPRKLSRDDRLVGALLMDCQEGVPAPATTVALAAAFSFRAGDEQGRLFPADAEFAAAFSQKGVDWALTDICGLSQVSPAEARIREHVKRRCQRLCADPADWAEE